MVKADAAAWRKSPSHTLSWQSNKAKKNKTHETV